MTTPARRRPRSPRPPRNATGDPPAPVLLNHRIDGWRWGARVALAVDVVDSLTRASQAAWDHGETEVRIGPHVFAVGRSERRGVTVLSNRDVRFIVDLKAMPRQPGQQVGWTVTIDANHGLLARHEGAAVAAVMRDILENLGTVEEVRVRRIDLATDWLGFSLKETDAMTMKRPSGPSRVEEFVEWDEELATRRHHKGARLTGISVCPGGDMMLRMYDKGEELRVKLDADKTATEHEIWAHRGWQEGDDVVRVEFQFRTEVLKEFQGFNALDVDGVLRHLDALWRYAVEKWCAIVVPGRTRISRSRIDPRWLAVQHVRWDAPAHLPRRARKRSGVRAAQVIGTVLSATASANLVPHVYSCLTLEQELQAFAEADIADDDRKRAVGRDMMRVLVPGLRMCITEFLDGQETSYDAYEHWAHRRRGAVARYAETLVRPVADALARVPSFGFALASAGAA